VSGFRLEHLLRAAAETHPSRPAIRDGRREVSYAELDSVADRVASTLTTQGVKAGDRVGIFLDKSIEAVAALYGTMRAGAAYVPIDPASPAARASYIATNAGIAALVSDAPRIEALQGLDPRATPGGIALGFAPPGFLSWDAVLAADREVPQLPVVDTDLAYILYTSGSTGQPKGVAISHRNSLTFVRWAYSKFGLQHEDVLSNHAPLHFDLSTFDLFATAAAGATVALVPDEAAIFPVRLAEWIREQAITVWYSVPSALTMLVRYGRLDVRPLSRVRLVLFAGEVFPVRFLATLMRLTPHSRFFNLFGPTETNVCTYYEVESPPADNDPPIPIGRACENTRCRVIDGSGDEARGVGSEGELVVTGSIVAQGYWGDPERTRERFDPPSTHRTGDIVEIMDDSPSPCLRFVGRRDHLVKTRGYRVELGEVEAALYAHPAVEECVAVAVPDELMGNRIVAFSNVRGEIDGDDTLRAHCRTKLPGYMVPDRIFIVGELPRTANDKIDRPVLAARAAELCGR
jgi:amino acid adenylation domain-containing protein